MLGSSITEGSHGCWPDSVQGLNAALGQERDE